MLELFRSLIGDAPVSRGKFWWVTDVPPRLFNAYLGGNIALTRTPAFLILLLWFWPLGVFSQPYLELFSATYGYSPEASFERSAEGTPVQNGELSLLLPIPTRKGPVLVTGLQFVSYGLQLDPESAGSTGFYALAPRIGLQLDYGNGWQGTHVLIPRLSTAFRYARDGIQGAVANLFQKRGESGSSFTFGLYVSRESYGWMLVPILGGYLSGEGGLWEIRLFLPAQGDINYRISDRVRAGVVFDGLGSTHDFEDSRFGQAYVQRISNDLQGYFRFELGNSLFLAVRAGYSFFRSYRVYDAQDTAGVSLVNIFFGEPRTPLNASVTDGLIFGVRLSYRLFFE